MHTFSVSKTIDMDVNTTWQIVDDFANTYTYHPLVEHSASLNGQTSGLGASRQCTMYGGKSVQEVITKHDADNMAYTVEVTDHGPFPLTHMVVNIQVKPVDGGRSHVSFTGEFNPKFGPVGWVMGKLVMRRQFESMLSQVIDGLEQYAKTGRVVGQGGKLEPSMSVAA